MRPGLAAAEAVESMASMERDRISSVPASGERPEAVPCPGAGDAPLCIREVRQVTPALVEAMGRLLPQLSERLQTPDAEELGRIAGSPSSVLLVAECGGCIVGSLTLVWYDAPSGRKAWIEDVVVDAARRGEGIGEALVLEALSRAGAAGAQRVMLTSSPVRRAAHALYRKVGFDVAETTVFVRKMDKS